MGEKNGNPVAQKEPWHAQPGRERENQGVGERVHAKEKKAFEI